MQKLALLGIAGLLFFLAACTDSYTPQTESNGEQIFQEVCASCHKADNKDAPGMIFYLTRQNANLQYISKKVHKGATFMPKFPNIPNAKMPELSDYVLKHSVIK